MLLGSTSISPANRSTLSFRFVLRTLAGNKLTPYVTHMETTPGDTSASTHGYCHGHYCETLAEAYNDLVKRGKANGLAIHDAQGQVIRVP